MKKYLLVLIIGVFFVNSVSAQLTKVNDSTIVIKGKVLVPPNHVYFLFTKENVLTEVYTGGEYVVARKRVKNPPKKPVTKRVDCVKIACPSWMDPKTICWQCVESNN